MKFIINESTFILLENRNKLNDVVVNKMKFTEDLVQYLITLFTEKYALWALNAIKNKVNVYAEDGLKDPYIPESRLKTAKNILPQITTKYKQPTVEQSYEMITKDIIRVIQQVLSTEEATTIADWLKSPHPLRQRERIDLGNLTWENAIESATEFHENIQTGAGSEISDEQGEIVIKYPDGFYWIRLGKHCDEAEAEAMGHCGTGKNILYSLRKDKKPYITIDYNEQTNIINQSKGRANTKPKEKYFSYILDFIEKMNVEEIAISNFRPQDDFHIIDAITKYKEKVLELMDEKPYLFNNNDTLKLIKEYPDIILNRIDNKKHIPLINDDYSRRHYDNYGLGYDFNKNPAEKALINLLREKRNYSVLETINLMLDLNVEYGEYGEMPFSDFFHRLNVYSEEIEIYKNELDLLIEMVFKAEKNYNFTITDNLLFELIKNGFPKPDNMSEEVYELVKHKKIEVISEKNTLIQKGDELKVNTDYLKLPVYPKIVVTIITQMTDEITFIQKVLDNKINYTDIANAYLKYIGLPTNDSIVGRKSFADYIKKLTGVHPENISIIDLNYVDEILKSSRKELLDAYYTVIERKYQDNFNKLVSVNNGRVEPMKNVVDEFKKKLIKKS